ncbi:MAG: phage tail tape measure protein [Gammaproteobacteria bacterium]|nr:MAG: phage tail tape measure protein [Gammaproteobacteria bacterium]
MSKKNLSLDLIINTEVKSLGDLNRVIDELEQSGENVDQLRKRSKKLGDAWDNLDPKQQAQRFARLREAVENTASGTEKAAKSVETLEKRFARLRRQGDVSKPMRDGIKQTSQSVSGLKSKLTAIAAAVTAAFATSAVARFFKSATGSAADLEEQLDKIQAVSGATDAEMAKIAATAKELGATTRYTATQAADGFEILARAGLDASQQIQVIPSVLALAQGQSISMAESAQFVGDAVTIMGGSFDEAGRYADVLAKGASQANTTVPQLANAIGYAGQYAKDAGLDIEKLTGVLDVLAQSGIRGERAGTALRNIFAQLQDPASNAAKELDKLGIKTDNLAGVIDGLKNAGAGGKAAINAFGTEAGPALRTLISGGSAAINGYAQNLRNAGGAAQAAAAKMDDNFKGALRGLSSAWESVKNTLGEPVLDPVKEQIKRLSGIIRDWVSSGEITKLGDYFAKTFGDMATSVVDFVRDFSLDDTSQKVNAFADNVTAKFDRVEAAFSLVYNTLSTGFNTVKATIFGVASAVTSAVGEMSQALAGFVGKIPGMDDIANQLQTHAGGVKAVAAAYKNEAAQAFNDAADAANRVQDSYSTLTQSSKDNAAATRDNAQAVTEEVAAFNAKTQRLAEITRLQNEFTEAGKKNTQEYNDLTVERINLETELGAAVEGKVLQEYESVEAQKTATKVTKATNEAKKKSVETDKKAAETIKEKAAVVEADTAATKESTEAKAQAAEATEKQAVSTQKLYDTTNLTKEQMNDMVSLYEKYKAISYRKFLHGFDSDFRDEIRQTADAYREINDEISSLDKKISDGTLSVRDLSTAFVDAKNKAKSLDDVTMARMEAALDRAKAKIKELAETARSEVADLEAELASVKGDDTLSRELEQKRKLAALEEKLAEARARNSREEIAAYERAIRLQKQIFAEKEKQIQAEEKRRNERQQSDNSNNNRRGSNNTGGDVVVDATPITDALNNLPLPTVNLNTKNIAQHIADAVANRERELSKTIAKDVEDNLAQQIKDVMKGRGT